MKLSAQVLRSIIDNKTNKLVITTHQSPDGDAIGSALGFYFYLKNFLGQVTVVIPDEFPSFLEWMPESEKILIYKKDQKKIEALVKESSHIFCLDFNSLKRVGTLSKTIEQSKAVKIIIDHHQQPESFADYYYVDPNGSSTSQLIAELIEEMQHMHYINKEVANCLYTGIMMDTGSFKFPSTTHKTHQIVAELIKYGAQNALIHQLIYDNNSFDRLRLLGYALFKKMEYLKDFHAAFISLDKSELEQYHYQKGDTEGLVNYPLSVNNIKLSALFLEKEGNIKCSFRSKGSFDLNKFARAHFNGGGHVNAAGGILNCSMNEAIKLFKNTIKEYQNWLIKP